MFDKLKKFLGLNNVGSRPEPPSEAHPKTQKKRQPKQDQNQESKPEIKLSPKELATANGEPYIAIISVELDPNNINSGSFELDWNDKFVINLAKSGYKIKQDDTDSQIVDRWFQTVCRNIALEVYEQYEADPTNRDLRVIRSRDIGNGRSEVS
ncbi:hypothetical protein EBU91_00040 [bacterium]|nr:hypothetical protein [bacterium]